VSAAERWTYDSSPDQPAKTAAADRPPKLYAIPADHALGEAHANLRQRVDSGWQPDQRFETPREELARFDPRRAGLPNTSEEAADRYLEEHSTTRPWLKAAERASPESRRILVAVDQGGGHGHIRHDGWVTEGANMRRAAFLEDPAQLDPEKRLRGIDGLARRDRWHGCADIASRISDPDAYATAFVRGTEHPRVSAAINTPYEQGRRPIPVSVPIAELLGGDGHKFCTGWQLKPVDGSMEVAISNRHAWRAALMERRQPTVLKPSVKPVSSFEGGDIIFLVGPNRARSGYGIMTLIPSPPGRDLSVI
jgi:hypothetical protein